MNKCLNYFSKRCLILNFVYLFCEKFTLYGSSSTLSPQDRRRRRLFKITIITIKNNKIKTKKSKFEVIKLNAKLFYSSDKLIIRSENDDIQTMCISISNNIIYKNNSAYLFNWLYGIYCTTYRIVGWLDYYTTFRWMSGYERRASIDLLALLITECGGMHLFTDIQWTEIITVI